MTTAYTSLLGLALPVTGELSGTWGDTVNNAITSLLDTAVAGTTSITTDADITLTTTTGASNQARQAIILWNPASGTTTRNITAPAQSKMYTVINASGGTQSIVLRGVGPTTGVTIVKGESAVCAWNGTDFVKVSNTGGSASFTNVTVTGTTTLSGLTASTALALDASKNVVSVTNTGTGNNVLATSPTLVTPALGTPSSGVVTNLTGTASININGTVGATTPASGAFTTVSASGVATFSAGTAALPAITTTGDTNTGIFFPAADTIAFTEGGTEAMRITSSGDVLVNTTSAVTGSKLVVASGDATIYGLTVGRGAGAVASNTAVGANALAANTSGAENAALGNGALRVVTTGGANTGVGNAVLYNNTTGASNTALGNSALFSNTTASNNTAVGYQAGYSNTTASNNVAVGYQARYSGTTGANNTAIGTQALFSSTTGENNHILGYQAGFNITSGSNNTAVGHLSGRAITTGNYNVSVGRLSMDNSAGITGDENTAIGNGTLRLLTSGANNVAVGSGALQNNTTASNNIALGASALAANTTGANNTAQGHQALASNTTASNNTAVGYQALYNANRTADANGFNTVLGYSSGSNITTGQYNTYIGPSCTASSVSVVGELIVAAANGVTGKGANTGFMYAGTGSGGMYQANNSSTWSTTSDRRLKKNIVDNTVGLEKIAAIQVRNFEYRLPEEVDAELKPTDAIQKQGVQLGVIAQELQQVLPDCVKTESTGVMSVNTDNLTWYLINAVKELKAEVDSLKSQLNQGA